MSEIVLTDQTWDEEVLNSTLPVIVDFWATSCPPCRKEIPHFIILYEKYRDEGF